MTLFLHLIPALVTIIVAAKAGGWLANRLGQPAVLGELLAGLLLGPSVLDMMSWSLAANVGDARVLTATVFELADFGVVCLMFLAGLEIDLGEMLQAGHVATLTGACGVISPLIMGSLAALSFGYRGRVAVFVGIILTATSVSISAQTLLELGRLRSREGTALLGAAVIDDILVILLLSLFLALVGGGASPGVVLIVVLKMVAYLVVASLLGLFLLPRLARWIHGQPVSAGLTAMVLVTALLFAWSAEVLGGLAAITGAFIAGVAYGRSHLRDEIEREMHTITYAFLVPIFFVSIGLRTDARLLAGPAALFAVALVLVAIASKIVGCGLGARAAGFSWAEALRVGGGMMSRGEVGLIVATLGVDSGLVGTELFSVVTVIVLATTLVTPPFLRLTFAGADLQKEASHA